MNHITVFWTNRYWHAL